MWRCERRLAAQCQLLQLAGIKLAENWQYGAGFKNGAGTVYRLVSKSMDAMVASMAAGGAAHSNARNAFCSIHAPKLLPALDFLCEPNASVRCLYYG